MPLVDMKDMLQHAYHHGYAVGAFGVAGWEILEGVVAAAENMRAPIILSVSRSYTGTDNIESLARAVSEMGQRTAPRSRWRSRLRLMTQCKWRKVQSTWAEEVWSLTPPRIPCLKMLR